MKRARRTVWKHVIRWCGAALILLASAELALRLTPFPGALETAPAPSTEFVDRTGQPLRMLLAEERRYSQPCTLAQVSPALLTATIAAEDRRFFTHHGVDPLAAARALWQYAQGRPPASGASTITMQLVKLAQPGPRTLRRKLAQTWLALRVERSWSKERILTEYLNRLDYGNLQVGIASASRFYFGKPAIDLSTAEACFLAGLPKAPTRLNPHQHFSEAQSRARWIQRRVGSLHLPLALPLNLPPSETPPDPLASEPIRLRPPTHDFAAPHFIDLLLARRDIVPARGGEIHTTLDLALNRFAERTLAGNLRQLTGKNATAGAAVVLDNATGDVLALAGAATASYAADVNTAWMIRSPGSAMKPFTYLLALQKGHHPGTIVPDVPTDFPTPTGSYRPNNYNHRFYGPVSLRFALGNSLNVGAIRVLELAGGPEALQRAMTRAGITTLDHPTDYYGLGLTLGNGEVRLLELANAYATLARLGEHRPFRLLLRDPASPQPAQRIFHADAAYLLADMLSDNTARASSFGLNSYLQFAFPVACKTGTSSDYRDNWCIGYTPEFTVAVWVGNPNGQPMQGITGVTGAAPVMHELFEHLHQTRGTTWYAQPPSVRACTLDPLTGHRVAENHPGAVREKCLALPPLAAAGDYNEAGRVHLPPVYAAWLASPQNSLGSLAGASSPSSPRPPLEILEPPAGSLFYLDPDLPRETQCIPLRAVSSLPLEWTSPSLTLTASRARLAEGRHELTAREPSTGRVASTWIEVKGL